MENLQRRELEELLSIPNSGESELIPTVICRQLLLNLPPRHGKSCTLTLFTQWVLGKNRQNRIITVSYNETLATRFSGGVRNGVDATKIDEKLVVF